MRRKAAIVLAVMVLSSMASGCISLTSWTHNKRHVKQVWNQFQGLHDDMDRIVFGLERNPAE